MLEVKLIQATPNPVDFIAKIASICYDKTPRSSAALVEKLYRNGHHSVFEHVCFTFYIADVSRACSHQLVRHRHCSFTQRSQRYCSEEGFAYVEPETTVASPAYSRHMQSAQEAYYDLTDAGVPLEDARMVLPNACCTSMYLSCNLRELMHIANERLCSRAQWEIREVVKKMVELVDPEIRGMLVPKCRSPYLKCLTGC